MYNMPVGGEIAAPNMQYVTFVPQAMPMMQPQQQAFFDHSQNYNYVYEPTEPTISAPIQPKS